MSTLNFLHIIAGDFNAAVFSFLKSREDFVPRVYLDGKHIPTLGVGYALVVKDPNGLYVRRSDGELASQLGSMGITLTSNDKAMLNAAAAALNSGTVPSGIAIGIPNIRIPATPPSVSGPLLSPSSSRYSIFSLMMPRLN